VIDVSLFALRFSAVRVTLFSDKDNGTGISNHKYFAEVATNNRPKLFQLNAFIKLMFLMPFWFGSRENFVGFSFQVPAHTSYKFMQDTSLECLFVWSQMSILYSYKC